MKLYTFAPISAHEYPTVRLLDHPYIWGGVSFSLNVSEKPYSPELEAALAVHGIEWSFCPVSEVERAQWWDSLEKGLMALDAAHKAGKKIIVHCDWGNNRSRSFVEAFHYLIRRKQLEDEYKGEINHLAYNCKAGHLPPLEETEKKLTSLWGTLNEDIVMAHLKRMIHERMKTFICGTPFQMAVYNAKKRYQNGEPVDDDITVDEVEMTVLDDWERVGCPGNTEVYAPMLSVPGEEPVRVDMDGISGFTPVRGHEYRLRVRRFYLTRDPSYHYYDLLELISDTLTS